MHLLAATPGSVDDGTEPVDLGQSPADLVVISAADTELAALSTARAEMGAPPTLRLANLTHLQHPMSVDLHLDECATKSRLVIARVLGGVWQKGQGPLRRPNISDFLHEERKRTKARPNGRVKWIPTEGRFEASSRDKGTLKESSTRRHR